MAKTELEQVQEILERHEREAAEKAKQPCCTPPELCRDCARIKAEDDFEALGGTGHKYRGR